MENDLDIESVLFLPFNTVVEEIVNKENRAEFLIVIDDSIEINKTNMIGSIPTSRHSINNPEYLLVKRDISNSKKQNSPREDTNEMNQVSLI